MTEGNLQILQWVWTAIAAPLIGWFAWILAAQRKAKRRKKAILARIIGLPMECKSILVQFHDQRAHTLRADPESPPIRVLVNRRIMTLGPGSGEYHAIDAYVSILPDVWEVMDDWTAIDPDILTAREYAAKPSRQI
jgi:hypothetical protein